jgi:hypothetical protein
MDVDLEGKEIFTIGKVNSTIIDTLIFATIPTSRIASEILALLVALRFIRVSI